MAKINPGELREMCTVLTTETVREKGISKFNYIPIATLRCKVKVDKNKYFYSGDNRKVNKSLVFFCHKRPFLIEDNFIEYKGKMYRITDVIPFDDYLYCQVFCERVE